MAGTREGICTKTAFEIGDKSMPKYLKVQYLVEDRGYDTPCLIWQGSCRGGYGLITNPDRNGNGAHMIDAHVYFWVKEHGPVPDGMILHHVCDVRSCVNPDHLMLKTAVENIRLGKVPTITKEIAEQIRLDLKAGMKQKDASIKYGISQPTISQIARGVTWR